MRFGIGHHREVWGMPLHLDDAFDQKERAAMLACAVEVIDGRQIPYAERAEWWSTAGAADSCDHLEPGLH